MKILTFSYAAFKVVFMHIDCHLKSIRKSGMHILTELENLFHVQEK